MKLQLSLFGSVRNPGPREVNEIDLRDGLDVCLGIRAHAAGPNKDSIGLSKALLEPDPFDILEGLRSQAQVLGPTEKHLRISEFHATGDHSVGTVWGEQVVHVLQVLDEKIEDWVELGDTLMESGSEGEHSIHPNTTVVEERSAECVEGDANQNISGGYVTIGCRCDIQSGDGVLLTNAIR